MDREELLRSARNLYENPSTNEALKVVLEEMYPELKESEGERIRKELLEEIEFIIPHDDETDSEGLILPSYHARIDRYKSYLEKQKEQKPLMSDGELEDRKRDIVAAIRKYYSADYAEYLTSFLKGLSLEDNSEDEYGQKMLGIAYKLMYEHIPENLRTQEFWDSLKFMREYTGKVAIIHSYEQKPAEQLGCTFTSYDMAKTFTEGQNYVIAHPEKFGLCKPTEWSEEDEDMLNSIIATYQLAAQDSDSEQARHLLEMQERFLKSLRPQPKQEWSEEDEDELNNILAFVKNDIPISGDTRREFYNWLKSIKNRGNSPKSNTNSSYWKPSEEQISALEYFIRSWGESGTMSPQNPTLCAAKSLLNDLQKLL